MQRKATVRACAELNDSWDMPKPGKLHLNLYEWANYQCFTLCGPGGIAASGTIINLPWILCVIFSVMVRSTSPLGTWKHCQVLLPGISLPHSTVTHMDSQGLCKLKERGGKRRVPLPAEELFNGHWQPLGEGESDFLKSAAHSVMTTLYTPKYMDSTNLTLNVLKMRTQRWVDRKWEGRIWKE